MNANGHLIDSLSHSLMFQNYQRAYAEATGLPLALRPCETWQLTLHGTRRENPFCALVAGKSSACAACLQTQEKLSQAARHTPATVTCAYGLCETAVPVKLGPDTIGYLQTGQVLRSPATPGQFNRIAQQLEECGVDVGRARELYSQTPVVAPKKMESVTHLLSIFADHLAMKTNQIVVQQTNAEPPVITKAKQFIQEHHSEELSLAQVSKAVNTSIFYFCKLFKKVTGINFTEYVSRTRVEKAKNLLLNPNLRISEIAYGVGFQSLSHFNRVFRKVAGESPTAYRGHLPKAA